MEKEDNPNPTKTPTAPPSFTQDEGKQEPVRAEFASERDIYHISNLFAELECPFILPIPVEIAWILISLSRPSFSLFCISYLRNLDDFNYLLLLHQIGPVFSPLGVVPGLPHPNGFQEIEYYEADEYEDEFYHDEADAAFEVRPVTFCFDLFGLLPPCPALNAPF